MACEVLEFPFEMCNAVSNSTSVRFQFGFTGPPRANSSAEARQVGAFSGESWQQVAQLSQLYLNFSLTTVRPSGEDIEDQLGAVDHFNVCHL